MSRCIHVYPFVARNHGGIPFSGVCPILKDQLKKMPFKLARGQVIFRICHIAPKIHLFDALYLSQFLHYTIHSVSHMPASYH